MSTVPGSALLSVPLLHTSAIYTKVKLDKNLGNYEKWYHDAKHHLTITHLISYTCRTARTPDPSELITTENWEAYINLAQAVILSALSREEWDFAEPLKEEKVCWDGIIAVTIWLWIMPWCMPAHLHGPLRPMSTYL
jgi:hypothetical protein